MNDFVDQAQRFGQMWSDFAGKMASAGMAMAAQNNGGPAGLGGVSPEMARQMRDGALAAMSSYAEQFMRSPEFLENMKRSLDASLGMRQQMNEFLTKMHHGGQGVARTDVDSLLAALHQMETRVLDRIEEVSSRVEELARRMESAESRGKSAEPASDPQQPLKGKGKGRN